MGWYLVLCRIVILLILTISVMVVETTLILQICITFAVALSILWILPSRSFVTWFWHLFAQWRISLSTLSCIETNTLWLILLLSEKVLTHVSILVLGCQLLLGEILRIIDAIGVVRLIHIIDIHSCTSSTLNQISMLFRRALVYNLTKTTLYILLTLILSFSSDWTACREVFMAFIHILVMIL